MPCPARPDVCCHWQSHALLMEHLLAHTDGLGHVRRTVVNIRDTTYIPIQAPVLLQEMLDHIVEKHG